MALITPVSTADQSASLRTTNDDQKNCQKRPSEWITAFHDKAYEGSSIKACTYKNATIEEIKIPDHTTHTFLEKEDDGIIAETGKDKLLASLIIASNIAVIALAYKHKCNTPS